MNRIKVNVITGEQKVVEWTDAEIVTILANQPPPPSYKELRAAAYPSLAEQADMAYWDRQNGTTTLDDAITAVKDKYPKGND